MKADATCTYCAHAWEETILSRHAVVRCPKCNDRQVRLREKAPKKDYYEGAPPFPEPEDDTPDEAIFNPFYNMSGD